MRASAYVQFWMRFKNYFNFLTQFEGLVNARATFWENKLTGFGFMDFVTN